MRIVVNADGLLGEEPHIEDPNDLTRLDLVWSGPDDGGLDRYLRETGLGQSIDPDHVFVVVARLRELAATVMPSGIEISDWDRRWVAMLSYAEHSNWLSADSRCVRVHVGKRA